MFIGLPDGRGRPPPTPGLPRGPYGPRGPALRFGAGPHATLPLTIFGASTGFRQGKFDVKVLDIEEQGKMKTFTGILVEKGKTQSIEATF